MSEQMPPYNSDDEGIEDESDVGEGPDAKVKPDYLFYMDKYQGYSQQPRNSHAKRIVADYIQNYVDLHGDGNEVFISNGLSRQLRSFCSLYSGLQLRSAMHIRPTSPRWRPLTQALRTRMPRAAYSISC